MSSCPKCGAPVDPGAKFCSQCGAPQPQVRKCPKCGAEVGDKAKFCGECGAPLASVEVTNNGASRTVGVIVDGHAIVAGDVVSHVTNNSYVVRDASRETVTCPRCGRVVTVTESFKCRICGEANICHKHYSQRHNCCESCAAKIEAPEFTRKAHAAFAAGDYAEAFKLAQKAEADNGEIAYILGYGYENGKGVEADAVQAVTWYRRGAEAGSLRAQNALGGCYVTGKGVKEDPATGALWIKRAAEGGDMLAQRNYGDCCYHGVGVPEDRKLAVDWYRKSAEQGWARAQYDLAECYANRWGVTADAGEAAFWYRAAADQSDGEFQFEVGRWCENGWEGFPENKVEAIKWYFMAAQQGYEDADEKLDEFKNLEPWEDPLSELLISDMGERRYLESLSDDPDVQKAMEFWYRGEYESALSLFRRCDENDPIVLYCLSDMYGPRSGRAGLVRDDDRSYRFMKASANDGNVVAIGKLAWKELLRGNAKEGTRLLQRAADSGHESSILKLSDECCEENEHDFAVKRDVRKASAYLKTGVLLGSVQCVMRLEHAIENPAAWFMSPTDFTMLRQACEKLDAKYAWASYQVGMIYEKGLEGHPDYAMAKKWYEHSKWDEAKERLKAPEFQSLPS